MKKNSVYRKTNPKASFDHLYETYSPKPYCNCLLNELDYRLPFSAMNLLKSYIQNSDCPETLNTIIIGSGHGLDSAVLKYNYTFEDILTYLVCCRNPDVHKFTDGDPRFNITMVDINEAPLRFARDSGLCDNFFVYDMNKELSEDLLFYLKNRADLAICTGATSYLNLSGFRNLIQALMLEGGARYFCFSLLSFLDNRLDIFRTSDLQLYKFEDVKQRDYKNEDEKHRILKLLKIQNRHSAESEDCLMASVYIATRAHSQSVV